MPRNPFASPYPIKRPEFLFGRESFMRHILLRLLGRYDQVSQRIVGLTRIGKTSILNCIASLGESESRSYVLQHFQIDQDDLVNLNDVVFVLMDCTGMAANTSDAFWALAGRQLTRVVAATRPSLLTGFADNRQQTFDDFYTGLQHLAQQGLLVVFLFDEFDRVIATLPIDVLDNLRFLLDDLEGHIVYTTATRRDWKGLPATWREPLSSYITTYFDSEGYVGLLESNGTRGFVQSLADNYNVRLNEKDIEFALLVGGRHPDLTRIVCRFLFDARQKVPEGDIDYQVISNHVRRDFESFYVNFWPELDDSLRDSLKLLVGGAETDLSQDVIEELAVLGLIVVDGRRFRLFSPIFEEFLHREVVGSTPILVTAQPQQNRSVASFPKTHVYEQRTRRIQTLLYIPVLIGFALLTIGLTVLVIGTAQFKELLNVRNPLSTGALILTDFVVVGFLMWQAFIQMGKYVGRRKIRHTRRAQANADSESVTSNQKTRGLLLELSISSLAGILSTLIAALILHLL